MNAGTNTVYFAHPINTYHTSIEEEFLDLIRRAFAGCSIINPSDAIHKKVVDNIKRDDPNANVMGYFENLVHSCDKVFLLPFADGYWGAGIYREAEIALQDKKLVFVVDYHTRNISQITELPQNKMLSIDETRARVYNLPERTIRPYL